MKHKFSKQILSALLAFVMVIGLIPAATMPVAAQNIIGLMYASGVRAGEGVVLMGDTTLVMDQDLSVAYIRGDYNLTIEGSGTLTVNGSGNGIEVKSLNCTSDLFIQTGWHAIEAAETVYINNAESFVVGGIYATGNIEIQSNNATIAGNGNAISSTGGNITLGGSTFDIGANGVAVYAETGRISMTGAFTVNSNNGRTINALEGEVVIDGSLKSTSGAEFDPEVHSIYRDYFSIGAANGFNFYGTTLEVTGLGGILAGVNMDYTDISITADSVSIIVERYQALYGGYIYVDSDELWLENQGSEENENVIYDYSTVFAQEDVTLSSESGGIVGEVCINAGGNLSLNGTFVAAADTDNGFLSALTAGGRMEANGSLTVRTDHITGIKAQQGFSFNGTTLDIEGYQGIVVENGDVSITAETTEITSSGSWAILGSGSDSSNGTYACNVYISSDYLRLQGAENAVGWGCIHTNGAVTIYSEDARLIGHYGIYADGDIYLEGNVVARGLAREAIYTKYNAVEARGSLSMSTEGKYHCLSAGTLLFEGTTLAADGYAGIQADAIDITADSVVITADVGETMDGDEIYVNANYLWAENKATKIDSDWLSRGETQFGINATSKLALTVENGTVIGYNAALRVVDQESEFEHHYIYVNGALTVVSRVGAGMYVPEGTAEGYGGPIVVVGDTHGIDAKDVYFDGGSLRAEGDTGIHAVNSVELDGEDVKITAFGERKSGIWTENGSVDLAGKVVIHTNGWYGVNAGGDMTFNEGYFEISGPEGNAQAVLVGGKLSVDGTLEIVKPIYGHVNGNDIYGTGNSPAMELEMYSAIPEVSLFIDRPREGELPTRYASGIYFLDPRCTVEEIVWYEDGEEMVSQDAVFRAGHRYTVEITISADGVYRFLEGVMGKVNDKAVSTGTKEKKLMYLTADLGECPLAIRSVELGITAPVEGNAPSTAVSDPSSVYGVYSRDVRWTVSTDGVNYLPMADGEKFVGGKYYRVFMDVNLAGKDYKFPVTTADGTVQPDVVATVNGSPAVTEKAYDQDPETVITVYFDFGKCNDSVIEEITIVDVVAPVAGQHPTYTANMFGTGYHIDTTKNAYEDIYWKNPPEKWYYVKNGVQWWDATTGSYEYVYENDTFLPGHTYVCQLYLTVEDGFTFITDENSMTLLKGTINGNAAEINEGWTDRWNARVTYTFTCEENVVDRIIVDGITAPHKGQAPDYTAILGNPDLYALDTSYGLNGSGIYWYDCEGRQLEEGERFGDAGPYRIAIKFVPASLENGGYVSQFSDDVEVQINGKHVTPYGDWDDVTVGSSTAWAFFTFRGASSAPTLGVTVSGTVTSFKDASGDITLQLLDYNSGIVAYETIVQGNTVTYSIDDVAPGIYILRATKAGHIPFECNVVVGSDPVIQNVILSPETTGLMGDVDKSEKVDVADIMKLKALIMADKWSDEELAVGDMDGSKKLDVGDIMAIKNIIMSA